jgi:lipoate-protein ligase A
MVGGGPVYLDQNQLFFQISLPVGLVPAFGPRAMSYLLAPAVQAFNDVGIPATFDERGDISVGDAKISGVAGGQIEACSLAVGNLVQHFDYHAMALVLGVTRDPLNAEVVRLMREFFRPTPADEGAFKSALIHRYATALGLEPEPGLLSGYELERLSDLDLRFTDPDWLSGPDRVVPLARQIKIRSGVWVFSTEHQHTRVTGSVIDERFERLFVDDPEANGHAAAIEAALAGTRLDEIADALSPYGSTGSRVAAAISCIDGRTL